MKTFLDGKKPLVAMIQCRTKEECIEKIRRSEACGAEAYGIQLCQLQRADRTEASLRSIFSACGEKPIYVTSYRYHESEGMSDAECAELLLRALNCGATLFDVIGDLFAKNEHQITEEPEAVAAQKALIEEIHRKGGEVLVSTHDFRDLSGEEVFDIARKQAERGADVLKIVVKSESKARLAEYLYAIQQVNEELQKPFLFLDSGTLSPLLRKAGPNMGTCMYLCVESHGPLDTKAQPLITELKQIRESLKS